MRLVGNGRLITRDAALPYLPDGAVVLDGDAVREVGTLADMRTKYPRASTNSAWGYLAFRSAVVPTSTILPPSVTTPPSGR